jgi:ethanolamine utilization protein EutM
MSNAIGFIETKGLVGALAAIDAMLKAADVTYAGKEITGPAMVLVKIKGDPASVKYALEAGKMAAENAGNFISSLVINEPDERLALVLPELNIEDNIAPANENKADEEHNNGPEQEIIKEPEHDNSLLNNNLQEADTEPSTEITLPEIQVEESITVPDIAVTDAEPVVDNKKKRINRKRTKKVKKVTEEKISESEDASAADEIHDEKQINEEELSSEKIIDYVPVVEDTAEIINEEITVEQVIDKEELPAETEKTEAAIEPAEAVAAQEIPEQHKKRSTKKVKEKPEPEDAFAGTLFEGLFDAPAEDAVEEEVIEINNSTVERLKREATEQSENIESETEISAEGEIVNRKEDTVLPVPDEDAPVTEETEQENNIIVSENPAANIGEIKADAPVIIEEPAAPINNIIDTIETKTEIKNITKPARQKKKTDNTKVKSEVSENNTAAENSMPANINMEYLTTINVHLLRKAARGVKNFPIQGREISKANRQVLLDYFAGLM